MRKTVAMKLAEVSGALSVITLPSAATVLLVFWLTAVVATGLAWGGGLGGRSRIRMYPAKRRLKFFPTVGAHSILQHS